MSYRNIIQPFAILVLTGLISSAVVRLQGAEIADLSIASAPVSIALTPDSKQLYVAEERARRITVLDANNGDILRQIPLSMEPSGVVISPDGLRLYVAGGGDIGQLVVYDALTGSALDSLPLGHTPVKPILDHSGQQLFVPVRFSADVAAIDCLEMQPISDIPALREPVAVALTPDGGTLVIANHLPSTRQIPEYMTDGGWMNIEGYIHGTDYSVSSVILLVDTSHMRIKSMLHLPNGSTGLRGVCVSPDGRFAYVTHILARYQVPTTQLERGWMNTNAVSVIDISRHEVVNTFLLDDIVNGAANPWEIACTPDGTRLIVTHAGTHEISIIDRLALHERLDIAANGLSVTDVTSDSSMVSRDLLFLNGIRTRVALTVNGPRAMAVTDSTVIVAGYFSDTVESLLLPSAGGKPEPQWTAALHDPFPETQEHAGERAFNDAEFCFQSWQSCASCHPDGRADGLNWDLLNDGIGNPKNTKSLLYSHITPPAMITGIRPSAEVAVRAGLRYIQFNEHPESDALAIDAYLKSMKPVPSPYQANPEISSAAARGEAVFVNAGCAACHPAPLYTDQTLYDVGVGTGREYGMLFDTPSLTELWRTAPYLYDGRAKDIDQVLRDYNRGDHHGLTSSLDLRDLDDLVCYLLML